MERDECRENWEWKANQSLMLPLWKLHLKFCLSNPEVGNPLTFILNLLSYCDAVFKRWNQNLYKKQSRMLSNILKKHQRVQNWPATCFLFSFHLFGLSTFCLFNFSIFCLFSFYIFNLFYFSTFCLFNFSLCSNVWRVSSLKSHS